MLPPPARAAVDALLAGRGDPADAAPLVERAVAEARAAHPDVLVPEERLVEHLAAKLPPGSLHEAVAALRVPDLYLALGCALGDPAALAAFEAAYDREYRAVLGRVRGAKPELDDFRQLLREKLFSPDRPKILEYAGAGELRAWVRVTFTRTLLDAIRKRTETEGATDERVRALPAAEADPELSYLKRLYTKEFKSAFEEAAAALSAEERNLLRYSVAEGLTVDQIGALYSVHRATAARRVASAREALLAGTRARLMAHLRLSRAELESVMRLIESELHVSVHRLFEPPVSPGA